jgi:ATP-dependent DNA helicase RecG
LGKQGKHWDSVPVPNVTVADLKPETFDFFRTAAYELVELVLELIMNLNSVQKGCKACKKI